MGTDEDLSHIDSLDKITDIILKCQKCSLYKTKSHYVPGVGNSNAQVMFVGEAPGRDEDLKGEPFVGAAGKFLTFMIETIEQKRSDVYIANILKCRPPNNRDPLPNEVKNCWPYLKKQIEIIKPKLVVLLGRHAMQRFFPNLLISKVHGKILEKNEQKYLVLYHPAMALYRAENKQILIDDFKKIRQILEETKKEDNQITQERLFNI